MDWYENLVFAQFTKVKYTPLPICFPQEENSLVSLPFSKILSKNQHFRKYLIDQHLPQILLKEYKKTQVTLKTCKLVAQYGILSSKLLQSEKLALDKKMILLDKELRLGEAKVKEMTKQIKQLQRNKTKKTTDFELKFTKLSDKSVKKVECSTPKLLKNTETSTKVIKTLNNETQCDNCITAFVAVLLNRFQIAILRVKNFKLRQWQNIIKEKQNMQIKSVEVQTSKINSPKTKTSPSNSKVQAIEQSFHSSNVSLRSEEAENEQEVQNEYQKHCLKSEQNVSLSVDEWFEEDEKEQEDIDLKFASIPVTHAPTACVNEKEDISENLNLHKTVQHLDLIELLNQLSSVNSTLNNTFEST